MDDLVIERGKLADAMPLILEHHYSRRRTADPVYVWLLRDAGSIVAAAVFTSPANRFFGKGALELSRLVRVPECSVPMTWFLAKCVGKIRADRRFKILLSYADTAAGHHGGVYQAANFHFVQARKGGLMLRHPDGRVVSGRSFDQSTVEYRKGFVRLPSSLKYLYVLPLAESWRSVRTRFDWADLPYPKPQTTKRESL